MFNWISKKSAVIFSICLSVSLAIVIGFLIFNYYHPVSLKITSCEIKDNTYIQHDKIYKTETCKAKENGLVLHVTVTDTVHTFEVAK